MNPGKSLPENKHARTRVMTISTTPREETGAMQQPVSSPREQTGPENTISSCTRGGLD